MQPIDKLTGSDFFPDVIGMKEHYSSGFSDLSLEQSEGSELQKYV
jgi:hypothetical protein